MKSSEAINEIATALCKAQSQMQHATKDAVNPAFKSQYATLASVIDAVKKPLTTNGIAFPQFILDVDAGVAVETVLIHSSGQWLSNTCTIPVAKVSAHGVGAAISYAKRYGLAAICGISAETDDDGNTASKSEHRSSKSVAKITVEESGIKDDGRLLDYVIAIRDALTSDDTHSLMEIWGEIDNDRKTLIWTKLDSKERSTIKRLLADSKEPA
jgi:hypothetical protein